MATSSIDTKAQRIRSIFSLLFLAGVIGIAGISVFYRTPVDANLGSAGDILSRTDELWVLFAASLVFFMQAGFLCYEVGLARPAHTTAVAIKNLVDWGVSTVGFVTIGFAVMFGASGNGLFGQEFFLLEGLFATNITVSGPTFFLFQLAFAGTAITLVSGSLVERTSLLAYSIIAVALAAVIYPLYGHWVWGNLLVEDNSPWLASLGFHDFAGGTVIHLLGATVALVGIIMIGPRIGRFGPDGTPKDMQSSSIGLSMLGVIILWFGWWGFNGGSFLEFNRDAITAIILTNLAAVSGLIGAGAFAAFFQNRYMTTMKLVGGAVTGLVAITPGADVVTPIGAVALGLIGGIVFSWGNDFMLKHKVDDALGVIPAHGGGAIVGTLGLAFFAEEGTFADGMVNQFLVQLAGVVVCILWAGGASYPVYWFIKKRVGLRVSPVEEMAGISLDNPDWPYQEDVEEDEDDKLDWSSAAELLGANNEAD